jgi:periplasmic protein TonB
VGLGANADPLSSRSGGSESVQLHLFVALGVSCVIHLGLVAGAIALGRDLAKWKTSTVIVAELVPADPPPSVETPTPPVMPRPKPPKRESFTLPKPITTPVPPPVAAPEPVDTPSPPTPSVETKPVEPQPEPARVTAGPPPSLAAAPGNVTATKTSPPVSDVGPSTFAAPSAIEPAPTGTPRPAVESPSVAAAIAGDGITRTAIPRGGYQVRPSYPSAPRRLGIQGTTTLRIYVSAEGRVTEVLVEQTAGHADLDHAAADAVRRWRFEPARRGTEAVGMWVLLPVEFRLR